MRLLLDAMYPAAIAQELRSRGHDVVAAQEDEEMRFLDDADLLARATDQGRAVVTENVKDFVPRATVMVASGTDHYGLVLTTNSSFPRHQPAFVGELVRALERFLQERPEAQPEAWIVWLDRDKRTP